MITIESNRLSVTIAEPNQECNTCRFDRAGFITQVTLDGEYEFCTKEYGGTNGMGLCSEIKFDPLSVSAPVGGKFLKPGVGITRRFRSRSVSKTAVIRPSSAQHRSISKATQSGRKKR